MIPDHILTELIARHEPGKWYPEQPNAAVVHAALVELQTWRKLTELAKRSFILDYDIDDKCFGIWTASAGWYYANSIPEAIESLERT